VGKEFVNIRSEALIELEQDYRAERVREAKILIHEKRKHQAEIEKINARLLELEEGAMPADLSHKTEGDAIHITLGRQFLKK